MATRARVTRPRDVYDVDSEDDSPPRARRRSARPREAPRESVDLTQTSDDEDAAGAAGDEQHPASAGISLRRRRRLEVHTAEDRAALAAKLQAAQDDDSITATATPMLRPARDGPQHLVSRAGC